MAFINKSCVAHVKYKHISKQIQQCQWRENCHNFGKKNYYIGREASLTVMRYWYYFYQEKTLQVDVRAWSRKWKTWKIRASWIKLISVATFGIPFWYLLMMPIRMIQQAYKYVSLSFWHYLMLSLKHLQIKGVGTGKEWVAMGTEFL